MGTRNRSEKLLAAHSRVLDVNSKTSEGCKLQVPCHAQSPGTQSLLAPQEQVLPRIGIPSSVIQYLGKEIQRAASTASSLFWWKNHQGWWLGQVKAWDRDVYDQYFVRSTLLTLRAYQDPGAYNLMYGKVFSAMPTCPVMTISRRADEPRSRRRSRGQDEEGRHYI